MLNRTLTQAAPPRTHNQSLCKSASSGGTQQLHTTMYLRQAGLTRNPTFSYLYSVRCRGQDAASKAPLERKYLRW
jgi:hypothetical protein